MKNLKKILLTSVIAATALGGGATALTKDVISPGGYKFIYPLWKRNLSLDLMGIGVDVHNYLNDIPNAVSYWHSWFWSNDQSDRTETTFLETNNNVSAAKNLVYYSAYSNSGYVAVIEVQTKNYFYYLEFDNMNFTVSLTYSKIGEYPKFYDAPIWTISDPISGGSWGDKGRNSILTIASNPEKTSLYINWNNNGAEAPNIIWNLPY